ncbi:uncharacterized protein PITG_22538 [Phytophthora infestans T30-4]|uniref:Uncharacterized protein n=1 Tax=Phytophthora infestans (strain T30-4) TaxID=403677 RepID=D0RMH1_PHYIT|nr:uncharacterized protein PITG_22538 [Phytophthora infestans T30-4]EEY63300.1 conserved hypothetical protein [Phytophthora infestans T30-4]|eukprot:XP_002909759.1 conserved hypothetical protein [Phytophthora infestans T30-4]
MELDQAISLWRGRAADAVLLGASSSVAKDGSRLVLLTSAEDVREISAPARKCINHWTFRAGSVHALHVAAARHPHSRVFFGVCGAPGVGASKKARQARRPRRLARHGSGRGRRGVPERLLHYVRRRPDQRTTQ